MIVGTLNEALRRVLAEKIRDVPATDLETVREYVRIIKELEQEEQEARDSRTTAAS